MSVQPSGAKSYVAVARDPRGKQVCATVGAADLLKIDEAREKARDAIKRIRAGLPPVEAKAETFGDVAGNWMARHVTANGLRSRAIKKAFGDRFSPQTDAAKHQLAEAVTAAVEQTFTLERKPLPPPGRGISASGRGVKPTGLS